MRVGVVGCGNVGFSTLVVSHEKGHDVVGYDPSSSVQQRIATECGADAVATSLDLLLERDILFICVPTDPGPNGECDLSIFEDVVLEISRLAQQINIAPIVIVLYSRYPEQFATSGCLPNKAQLEGVEGVVPIALAGIREMVASGTITEGYTLSALMILMAAGKLPH